MASCQSKIAQGCFNAQKDNVWMENQIFLSYFLLIGIPCFIASGCLNYDEKTWQTICRGKQ